MDRLLLLLIVLLAAFLIMNEFASGGKKYVSRLIAGDQVLGVEESVINQKVGVAGGH